MNIRKAFLLTLIIAIAFIGLTLTGCEKKSDEPAPSAETASICPKCGEAVGSDACCMTKAAEEAGETAEGVKEEAEKTATELLK